MATHSSILAWRIPWTEEPGGLQSMGLQESDTTERLNNNSRATQTAQCARHCPAWDQPPSRPGASCPDTGRPGEAHLPALSLASHGFTCAVSLPLLTLYSPNLFPTPPAELPPGCIPGGQQWLHWKDPPREAVRHH